jgi:hypothetical protein
VFPPGVFVCCETREMLKATTTNAGTTSSGGMPDVEH